MYCSVWDGLSQTLNDKLQKLQYPVARVITKSRYDASAGPLLDMLGWDRVMISLIKKKRQLSCAKHLTIKCPPMCKICSLFVLFITISGALRTSCMYPKPRTEYLE